MYRNTSHDSRHEHNPENRNNSSDAHQGDIASMMALNSSRSRSPNSRHPIPGIGARRSYDHQDYEYEPLPLHYYSRDDPYPSSLAALRHSHSSSHSPRPEYGVYEADRGTMRSHSSDAYSLHHRPHESIDSTAPARKRRSDDIASEDSLDSGDGKGRPKKQGSKKRPLTAYRMFYRDERSKLLASQERSHVSESKGTAGETRKRSRSEDEKLPSREELDRLVDEKWKVLSPAEKQRYAERALEESSSLPSGGQEAERSTPAAFDGAAAEQGERRSYMDVHRDHDRISVDAPILFRNVDGSTVAVSGRHQSFLPPPAMSSSHRSRNNFPNRSSHGGPALSPLGDQYRSYPDLAQHQSAMQFDNAHRTAGTASRDRLELPPSRTVMVHDLNGMPRRYELMYAAISLPFESASEYLAALSSATTRLLDGSAGAQGLSSVPHQRGPPYQPMFRPEYSRSEEMYDPRENDYRQRR